MATKHGKGVAVLINGLLLSAYFNNADISRTCDTAEDTAFQDTFKSYIPGLHDGSISLSGMWDAAANDYKLAVTADGTWPSTSTTPEAGYTKFIS